jgi:hypothetical protein
MELTPPPCSDRLLNIEGPRITSHAITRITTTIMSVNPSTYLLPEKTLTTGFSAVVDGQRMTMPTWNT